MLILSELPGSTNINDLLRGYSILMVASIICYISGLFALNYKSAKWQRVFLILLCLIMLANIGLVIAFKQKNQGQYLMVSVFLLLLNLSLSYKAVQIYKKLKGKMFEDKTNEIELEKFNFIDSNTIEE